MNNLDKIILFFTLILFISCKQNQKIRVLPIIGNYDVIYDTINGKEIADTVFPTIPKFRFLNEDSNWVTNKNFKGKILIAEFFFASCPTICPVMNKQMQRFVNDTKDLSNEYHILSFTINPKDDVPTVLRKYKKNHSIEEENWSFLTGVPEEEVHTLGIENFKTFAGRDEESAGGYAHSGAFTLVDKSGYVRGVYSITNYDSSINEDEYKRLVTDFRKLLKHEYNVE